MLDNFLTDKERLINKDITHIFTALSKRLVNPKIDLQETLNKKPFDSIFYDPPYLGVFIIKQYRID